MAVTDAEQLQDGGAALANLWIGGADAPAASGETFEVRNPLDDSVIARAAKAGAADVDRAVRSAHEAFAAFRAWTPRQREALLSKCAERLEARRGEFADILIDEVGSPIHKAHFEIGLSVDFFRAAAGASRMVNGKTLQSDVPGRMSLATRSPRGVVAAITPFNVPLIKGVRLVAHALAAGNTVVLLPSEEAPLLSRRLAHLFHEAGLPPGALNVVSGFGYDIGDALTGHELVKFVTFTGSSRVGKHIAGLCGPLLKPVTLELGGKSPLVVMADADLDAAVQGAARGIFTYQGQVCMGSSRVFVERPVFDTFLDRFRAAAESLKMGDLRDPETVLGPIISRRQRDRVRGHVEDAVAKGARLVTGGGWEGHRAQPTILTGVTPAMKVYMEETFGPVVALYPIDSFEEGLRRANETSYGLSAAIYTKNLDHALRFAQEIESGMAHVNAPSLHDEPHVPFGGSGDSGLGREGTEEDIAAMTEWKWITIQM
ncbi:MAG: aldehyde dehydrogenase family protein [Caulobacterales bacterium]|nr:aldehyde dehydrogenase family protein [Caulobacterales bacterium]